MSELDEDTELDEVTILRDRIDGLIEESFLFLYHMNALEHRLGNHDKAVTFTHTAGDDGEAITTTLTIDGATYSAANGDTVRLCADSQVLDDGYDEANGQRYKRIKPGQMFWYLVVNGAVKYVTAVKPKRTATDNMVTLEWGKQ